MSEIKHTPKPWEVYCVHTIDGTPKYWCVVSGMRGDSPVEIADRISSARDARLIAEAPEMAELVDELSDRLSIEYGDAREDSDAPEIVKARALLLRIHGESA